MRLPWNYPLSSFPSFPFAEWFCLFLRRRKWKRKEQSSLFSPFVLYFSLWALILLATRLIHFLTVSFLFLVLVFLGALRSIVPPVSVFDRMSQKIEPRLSRWKMQEWMRGWQAVREVSEWKSVDDDRRRCQEDKRLISFLSLKKTKKKSFSESFSSWCSILGSDYTFRTVADVWWPSRIPNTSRRIAERKVHHHHHRHHLKSRELEIGNELAS